MNWVANALNNRALGAPPLPLAGKGWGGGIGELRPKQEAPSLSLPRKRERGPQNLD
jgi:hypothetical protein